MSTHEETEHIHESTLSASEFNSKSEEAVTNRKQLDPIDFLIVTRIPEKSYKFQWIIRQFSTLSKNKELYSTCIHALATSCYQLKLVKYEHGFGLFHVSRTRVQSNETSTAKSQNKELSNQTGTFFENSTFGSRKNRNLGNSGFAFGGQNFSSFHSQAPVRHTEQTKEADNANKFPINLEYQVSTTDSRGKELLKWSVCFSDDSESKNNKIGEYINNTLEIFPDDSLILDCDLKVILMPISEEIPIASKPSLECNNWKKLSTDLKALYQNSLDTDITLIAGTDKIHAHKLILTARSAIFKKIFHHNMEEAEENSVAITDVQFSVLQRLIEFLYTGVIVDGGNKDMDFQDLYDLYYAADKYEVMDLREMVGNTLLGRIQVDNASEILILADRHNDKDLKSRVMNFIRLNFEVVANTDAWESCALHHPKLAMEVVNFYVKKIQSNENQV
ncbi:Speckle-type POZ protein B [Araneus ventricosus]|uniref:Speckle-type POZ protein B n=1 Tax=Araneus ventricosus TaxID=182803 RepID=A0A4Y2C5B4_ARAVE|nr:Speckle-type POZ protein B [Araneus ventricosus]